ncbi:zinc finger CW-type PWWP domain protein 2 isoform X2 [Meriones unguiculatus]|uniref:zinc finger CW-type PWWP domain protein 2 isoform X2 n=1 Tax=Meriones unguiculatus TaxID=10047 RepID=UPI00293E715D|nr:zinc finger CW-type PWWP domain protein 2 isoform X2 [Meriones unguiculatus]
MDAALEISEFVNRVWVQCENESCLKWRLLSPKAASRVDHSKPWYCFMNADSSYNSCSVSEEDFPEESQFLERGYKIVYSQLPLGSLVLVKLQNWPSWPGILCPDPFKGKYVTYDQDGNVENYYIEYLGEPHATAWMSAAFVGHFSLTLQMAEYTNKNRRRWYRSALEEAYRLYWCSPEQRLEACCLSKQGGRTHRRHQVSHLPGTLPKQTPKLLWWPRKGCKLSKIILKRKSPWLEKGKGLLFQNALLKIFVLRKPYPRRTWCLKVLTAVEENASNCTSTQTSPSQTC